MNESPHKLLIKNMVCSRCVMTIAQILKQLEIPFTRLAIGEIYLPQKLSEKQASLLAVELHRIGLELMETRMNKTISMIKKLMAEYLSLGMDSQEEKLSVFIANRMSNDFGYLSDLFAAAEGITIEQYFIRLRIEKVKELIVYEGLSFTDISYQTGFSSVHHLSAQFKKVTGLTPSHFKSIGAEKRKALQPA